MGMQDFRIALTGKIRSGKDTVARYLMDWYNFNPFALGDGIRRVCSLLYPDVVYQGKPRALYQGVGQDLRNYNPDVWIDYMFRQMDYLDGTEANIVVTDLRQLNEYKRLKEAGFSVVRVTASEATRLERMAAAGDQFIEADLNHEVEQYIDTFKVDYELSNDGRLDDLYNQIELMLERWGL